MLLWEGGSGMAHALILVFHAKGLVLDLLLVRLIRGLVRLVRGGHVFFPEGGCGRATEQRGSQWVISDAFAHPTYHPVEQKIDMWVV